MAIVNQNLQQIIHQDYPESQHVVVADILGCYGKKDYERDHDRVRLAALKIADGDVHSLKQAINSARGDYRDVIAWAEYPNEMDRMIGRNKLTRREATEADQKQMQEWLDAHGLPSSKALERTR
jgi:hypothetical protein